MPLDAAEILCKMRQFSLIVLCILSINESSSAESPLERYQWGVERVVDGDTIKVNSVIHGHMYARFYFFRNKHSYA